MEIVALGKTDVGQKRSRNEDAFLVMEDAGLFAVSDGMGGHAAGDVASRTALEAVVETVRSQAAPLARLRQPGGAGDELIAIARQAALAACKAVYDRAVSDPRCAGMGCTLTLLLTAGGNGALAHVGDSRAYLLRGGRAHQLTTDHTMAQEMVAAGVLTPEQAAVGRLKHVLSRAVGTQASVQVDTLLLPLLPNDRLLLCSDGLHGYFADVEAVAAALGGHDLGELPEQLVDLANERGGNDNITAVVVGVQAVSPTAATEPRRQEIEQRLAALDSVFLFDDLPLLQRLRVLRACEERDLAAGERLFSEGAPCSGLAMVLEGTLSVVHRRTGQARIGPQESLGVSSLLHPRPCFADVTALQPSRLLLLQRDAFLRLCRVRPGLGIHLLERLGRHLSRRLDERNQELSDLRGTTTGRPKSSSQGLV